ncbi:MAG: class I SAM-dependent methyltransferase [Planctomycetales bacterium]
MIRRFSRRLKRVTVDALLGTKPTPLRVGEQKDSSWYDTVFAGSDEFKKHYTESVYYAGWTIICDRLVRHKVTSILDIGCGPGQFASLLSESAGHVQYLGLDFCAEAIRMAEAVCPARSFLVADVFVDRNLEDLDYDAVVSLEFLEHVDDDIPVLQRIRPGTLFIGSVPNFPSASHVRHFTSAEEVTERYGHLFSEFTAHKHLLSSAGQCLYVMEGTRLP